MATILVVDDEPDILELLQMILEDMGCTILSASNGEEALTVCHNHADDIQVLITDLLMPSMNGHELAKKVSETYPGIKVIYMSGEPPQLLIDQGRLSPDAATLGKPFDLQEVEDIVKEILEKQA